MTPKREAYIKKCSKRENWFRKRLSDLKITLKALKILADAPVNDGWLARIKCIKWEISAMRHEINRIKGMDRVCVPKVLVTGDYMGFDGSDYCHQEAVMQEMESRGYEVNYLWSFRGYRGKSFGKQVLKERIPKHEGIVYPEHDDDYLKECIENLKAKGIAISI